MSSSAESYKKSYEVHLQRLREKLGSEAEAVAEAVGGEFAVFGQLQFDLLTQLQLKPTDTVVDVGCGCGRLAFFLKEYLKGRYYGYDVVTDLVDYARTICERPDWTFQTSGGTHIPAPDGIADFVCFFSVLTHLTPEDGYRYVQDAMRVLKPGGRIVLSFLDFGVPSHWQVFQHNLAHPDKENVLNQFLGREAIQAWAHRLGLEVCALLDSEAMRIPLSAPLQWSSGMRTEGACSLGQSVAVLSKGSNPLPEDVVRQLSGSAHLPDTDENRARHLAGVITDLRTQLAVESATRQQLISERDREITGLHDALREALTQAHRGNLLRQEDAQRINELKAELEEFTHRLRSSEDQLALAQVLAKRLGHSLLPGALAQALLPSRAKLREALTAKQGTDLPGPAVVYYLFTTPYRIYAPGRHSLNGWCYAREGQPIKAVRARLDERGYTGGYGFASSVAGETTPPTASHSQSGFAVEFEVKPGRQQLRVEADIEGHGWVTFLSTPLWARDSTDARPPSA